MKTRHLSFDIISALPSSIIETILCLVPIKEAARTSILSKEWRYKWTKIPELVFDDSFFKESTDDENQVSISEETMASERKKMGKRCKLFNAINQVLLMRQGPIHEFTLHMEVDKTCLEIDHIISYLSRNNTVKKLKLGLFESQGAYYWLPSSVFSLHDLTDLHLSDCDISVQQTFSGFARLTKLYLKNVSISMKTLLHIISNSPRLKHFTLIIREEQVIGVANSTVLELFKCLPVIEHLSVYSWITRCFVIDSISQELPALLIHLKYFYMDFMSFSSGDELRLIALLIRSSPNLQKITLDIFTDVDDWVDDGTVYVIREAYSDIKLERLNELEIYGFGNLKAELEFVKFMLAKSPKLKTVRLCFEGEVDKNEESKMLRILLRSPTASPVVDFIVTSRTAHHLWLR